MNKKLLVVAVASALVAPLSAQAELKLSGTIQAEMGSVSHETLTGGEREMWSADGDGALVGGGPNKIRLDFDEKLSSGLTAFGRVDFAFDTADASGLKDRESFVGLKGSNAHFKFGRIEGMYKATATGDVDPLYSTGIQARSLASGMSAGTNFAHSSFVDNVVELGFNTGGFSIGVQTTLDERAEEEGSVQLGIQYRTDNWGVFMAGAYHDFEFGNAFDTLTGQEDDSDGNGNAKVGGWFKTGGLKLGLQYEMAEEGTLASHTVTDPTLGTSWRVWDEADYIMGSAAYTMGNVTVAGWVAGYMSDFDNEDAMSFSLAAIYSFSKRTIAYAGYHDTSSDNDARDWDAIAAGIRHSF